MKYEKNLLSRFTPLKLKDLAIRYGFDHYGEEAKTLTLTNLGRVDIPASMVAYRINGNHDVSYGQESNELCRQFDQ